MTAKGGKREGSGRPKGTRNEKTKQWEQLGEAIQERHTERFNTILESLPDDKFSDKYLQILEYFKPKQQRTEIKGEVDTTIHVTLK